jgi:acetyltransferase-like isoleucine patch superfamily enzyme
VFRFLPGFLYRPIWSLACVFDGAVSAGIKYSLLKSRGAQLGSNVYIGAYVTIKCPSEIMLGNNVSIHSYCYIDATGGLSIGNDVSIAHNVSILTTSHTWTDMAKPIKYNELEEKPVNIQDDVWIGAGVRILSGADIAPKSIIASGAVLTSKIYSGRTIWGGVPARALKKI